MTEQDLLALTRDNERLREENARLARSLADARAALDGPEDVVEALRHGEVDAVVVEDGDGVVHVYALQAFDAAYRRLVEDSLPFGLWLADTDGRLRYASPAFLALTGASLDELRSQGSFHFLPSPEREELATRWSRCVADGDRCELEYTVASPGGEVRTVWMHGVRTATPDGGAVWVGVNLDVTERLRAEREARRQAEALRESEQRFAQLADAMPQAVWIADDEGRISFANRAWEEFTGLRAEDARGFGWIWSVHPDDRERSLAAWREAIAERRYYEIESRSRRQDGQFRWVLSRATPILDPTGRSRMWFGTTTDIQERRHSVERLRLLWEAAAALLTTQEPDLMLREVFGRIGPSLELDLYLNYMVEEDSRNLRLLSFAGLPADMVASFSSLKVGQAICGAAAAAGEMVIVPDVQRGDDPRAALVRAIGMRTYVSLPLLSDGKLLGTLSFGSRSRDAFLPEDLEFLRTLSHYVTVAIERHALVARLHEADRRKDEFLATLAHELRNPLAPLRNVAHLLASDAEPSPQVRTARGIIDRQVTHVVRLIDDLLDVGRITRGKLQVRREQVDLRAVLQQSIESTRQAIDDAGLALELVPPDEPIPLDADPVRLAQVFINLLQNACKYTDAGGRVRLSARHQGDEAVVSVEDTGIGIAPEHIGRVFTMFAQVPDAVGRSEGGLGIGLSLARAVVEMHGGTIRAHSDGPGCGSCFEVRLPVATASVEVPGAAEEPVHGALGLRHRILVADDNSDGAESLAMLLRLAGHEVTTAADGVEALEIAERIRPTAVLLDLGMPRLDGYEVCRRLRGTDWGQHLLLIAQTGWGSSQDRGRTRAAGFDEHLVKPVEFGALSRLLSNSEPVPA